MLKAILIVYLFGATLLELGTTVLVFAGKHYTFDSDILLFSVILYKLKLTYAIAQ